MIIPFVLEQDKPLPKVHLSVMYITTRDSKCVCVFVCVCVRVCVPVPERGGVHNEGTNGTITARCVCVLQCVFH